MPNLTNGLLPPVAWKRRAQTTVDCCGLQQVGFSGLATHSTLLLLTVCWNANTEEAEQTVESEELERSSLERVAPLIAL